jgi:prepilin-type N-terminal cleavage/methylation domain-containing protein
MRNKGFTLMELVMIIVILGILAVIAIPKYFDLQQDAKEAAEKGVVGSVRAGLYTYYAKNKNYPTALGGADGAATKANPLFNVVLTDGITQDWTKAGANFTGPNSGVYVYDSVNGSFK